MSRRRRFAFAAVVLCAVLPARSAARQAPDVTFGLTGDWIVMRKMSVYSQPALTRVIERVRGADVA